MGSPARRRRVPDSDGAGEAARLSRENMSPEALTLDTRLRDELRVPDIPIGRWGIDELEESFRRLSIPYSERRREGEKLVLDYECTIRDAIRLGYDQGGKRELAAALLKTYPELASNEVALTRRLRALKAEWNRQDALLRAADN